VKLGGCHQVLNGNVVSIDVPPPATQSSSREFVLYLDLSPKDAQYGNYVVLFSLEEAGYCQVLGGAQSVTTKVNPENISVYFSSSQRTSMRCDDTREFRMVVENKGGGTLTNIPLQFSISGDGSIADIIGGAGITNIGNNQYLISSIAPWGRGEFVFRAKASQIVGVVGKFSLEGVAGREGNVKTALYEQAVNCGWGAAGVYTRGAIEKTTGEVFGEVVDGVRYMSTARTRFHSGWRKNISDSIHLKRSVWTKSSSLYSFTGCNGNDSYLYPFATTEREEWFEEDSGEWNVSLADVNSFTLSETQSKYINNYSYEIGGFARYDNEGTRRKRSDSLGEGSIPYRTWDDWYLHQKQEAGLGQGQATATREREVRIEYRDSRWAATGGGMYSTASYWCGGYTTNFTRISSDQLVGGDLPMGTILSRARFGGRQNWRSTGYQLRADWQEVSGNDSSPWNDYSDDPFSTQRVQSFYRRGDRPGYMNEYESSGGSSAHGAIEEKSTLTLSGEGVDNESLSVVLGTPVQPVHWANLINLRLNKGLTGNTYTSSLPVDFGFGAESWGNNRVGGRGEVSIFAFGYDRRGTVSEMLLVFRSESDQGSVTMHSFSVPATFSEAGVREGWAESKLGLSCPDTFNLTITDQNGQVVGVIPADSTLVDVYVKTN
jgi:hypothetical protein